MFKQKKTGKFGLLSSCFFSPTSTFGCLEVLNVLILKVNGSPVYATGRSKAVVPVLFLILCRFVVYTTGRLMF